MREVEIVYLNPRDLLPSRQNVRSDPGDLAGLAETIREHGILQPLGVTREADGYRLVYGNRRRAASIVVGLNTVPCIVLDDLSDEGVVVQQVLENLQRLDLNDLDKSRAFEDLVRISVEQGLSQGEALDAMARSLGLSVRQIQRYLRLGQLSPVVQQLIAQGDLGVTLAQHLVAIEPNQRQEELARLAVDESMSAAELARLSAALEHNANIDPQRALEMQRRGDRVPIVEERVTEGLPRMGPPPALRGSDGAPWDESDDRDPIVEERGQSGPVGFQHSDRDGTTEFSTMAPTTRDGNRVRRIHSLDAFMDELQRLAQCVQEGDYQRFVENDPGGAVKTNLAARQLHFLADAISALAKALGQSEG
jgi:ParB family chromosome partitioning protein